jgi:dipeptide/tripeptide permease
MGDKLVVTVHGLAITAGIITMIVTGQLGGLLVGYMTFMLVIIGGGMLVDAVLPARWRYRQPKP